MIGRTAAAVAAVEAVLIAATAIIALDIYAHHRVEDVGGLNMWGYRGRVALRRQPNEVRVEVVGGTRAFGWGEPGSSLASQIRRLMLLAIDRPGAPARPVTVVNVGRLGALPDSYPATLEHFAYLRPDIVCIYDDLGVRGAVPTRSAVYDLTGYMPALPLVVDEKGKLWRTGAVARGYDSDPAAVVVPAPKRLAGASLEAAGEAMAVTDAAAARWLGSGSRARADQASDGSYVDSMLTSIDSAHRHAAAVVVVLSPAEMPMQQRNAAALRTRLPEAAPWLRVVDLDAEPRLRRGDLRYDGWNYGGAATTVAAEHITPAVLEFIR